jgi:hypothetical protein
MVAGAVVTVTVSWVAGAVGEVWSGLLAAFPAIGSVLAPFSHRRHGGAYVTVLLRLMTMGMYSFVTFFFALSLALPRFGIGGAFVLAIAASLVAQLVSKKFLRSAPGTQVEVASVKER